MKLKKRKKYLIRFNPHKSKDDDDDGGSVLHVTSCYQKIIFLCYGRSEKKNFDMDCVT